MQRGYVNTHRRLIHGTVGTGIVIHAQTRDAASDTVPKYARKETRS